MNGKSRSRMKRIMQQLSRCRSGVAMTEFALSMPLLMTAGLMGLETSYLAITQMKISDAALHIADNASRIGDTSTLTNRKIYESDINDLLAGVNIASGVKVDLFEHGRVIISSLEQRPGTTTDEQYIHWQRCLGKKNHASSYGVEGDGLSGGMTGMGPAGTQVMALPNDAVMFVEVAYDYQPLVGDLYPLASELTATAAFNVRDSRDLTAIYQRTPSTPDRVADCSVFDNPLAVVPPAGGTSTSTTSSGASGSNGSNGGNGANNGNGGGAANANNAGV